MEGGPTWTHTAVLAGLWLAAAAVLLVTCIAAADLVRMLAAYAWTRIGRAYAWARADPRHVQLAAARAAVGAGRAHMLDFGDRAVDARRLLAVDTVVAAEHVAAARATLLPAATTLVVPAAHVAAAAWLVAELADLRAKKA